MWIDTRKNWHIINHAYDTTQHAQCGSSTVSAHFFSVDGKEWHLIGGLEPYGHTVSFDDGTTHTYSTLERPNIFFDKVTGVMTHLVVAADLDVGDEGCANRTSGWCKRKSKQPCCCNCCKFDDHTGTLVVALNVSADAFTIATATATATSPLPLACDLFVSYATGSDTAPGTSASAPLKTLQHALYKRQGVPNTICLRSDGTPHLLDAPLYISNKASSLPSAPLTITGYGPDIAAGKGRPTISAGATVGPFAPDAAASARLTVSGGAATVWSAPIPAGVTDRPTVMWRTDGSWLQRARHPRRSPLDVKARHMGVASTLRWTAPLAPGPPHGTGGAWPAEDKLGFEINSSDFAWLPAGGLHRMDEVQVLHFHSWTAFWSDLKSITVSSKMNSTLMFAKPANVFVGQYAVQGGQRFLLENIREALDEPGEWYWDEGEGKVYLVPSKEEIARHSLPAAPGLYTIAPSSAKMSGVIQINNNAQGFTLQDVEIKHGAVGSRINAYYSSSAAVHVQDASNVRLARVRISSSGGNGVLAQSNVKGLQFLDSAATGLGADGFAIMSSTNVSDVLVNNSFFNSTAWIILGQPGAVRLKGEAQIVATHNTIGFHPYAGLMLGWQDGLTRSASAKRVKSGDMIFTATHNLIHDFGLGILSDFGGIYLSAGSTCIFGGSTKANEPTCWLPSKIAFNEVRRSDHFDYGGSGIYMDEQVSGIDIESNVFFELEDSGVYFHCGADNTFANNIVGAVAFGKPYVDDKILPKVCNQGGNPTWPDMHGVIGFSFERNIVLVVGVNSSASISTSVDSSHMDVRNGSFAGNLYWSTSPAVVADLNTAPLWPNVSLTTSTGKKRGVDWKVWSSPASAGAHVGKSAIGDPLFVSADWAQGRDFDLNPASPAIAMGFVPFDTESAGCDRATNVFCETE